MGLCLSPKFKYEPVYWNIFISNGMDFTAVLYKKGRSVYLHNKLQLSPLSQFAPKKNDSSREENHAIAWQGKVE
jgi:hypothetical protein